MDFFKKDKMPTKKKANKGNNKNLSKYLPTTLFIGVQEDVNEKALTGYIMSLSQSAFSNLKEVKYSTRKLGKNRFVYEIHNGSKNLTYLPLVVSNLIEGTEKEIILKTQAQNVRVIKKTATKIESNTLISSNNRDDDAQVDLDTNGKLKELVKQGTEVLLFSIIASSITGVLAGASFFSKYYMLNEDYSYNPSVPKVDTPYEFLQTLEGKEHTKHRYLENIRFQKGKWNTNYIEIENKEKETNNDSKESDSGNESINNDNKPVVNENNNGGAIEETIVKSKRSIADESREERRQRIIERRKQKEEERRLRREDKMREQNPDIVQEENVDIMKDALSSEVVVEDKIKQITEQNVENYVEPEIIDNNNNMQEIENPIVENQLIDNQKDIFDAMPVKDRIQEVEVETINVIDKEGATKDNIEHATIQKEEDVVIVDEFEIVEEISIDSLDLSNLPDNVILEEGDK